MSDTPTEPTTPTTPTAPAGAELSRQAQDFSWTVDAFVRQTDGVTDAIVVSADGLPIAASETRGPDAADRLSAIVSGLASLAGAVTTTEDLGPLNKIILDLADGYLLVAAIGHRALLGVRALKESDLGTVAFEMTVYARQAGARLTPPLVRELQRARPL
ncbi:putative regulator of Ras-like GTPase activity (Roadblock/LC7/MglB family) [Catenulispora sp. MAP12-49]|uniref:roadblock/LC7 domain-containing protein n=1 Tax=Catenulispora sp. MAP12-49 TaxID=3156302 RepID=UPI003517E186